LRRELVEAPIFIGIVTSSSVDSAWVLFELGARWGQERYLVPMLDADADYTLLPGPIHGQNALKCNDEDGILKLVVEVAKRLRVANPSVLTFKKQLSAIVTICGSNKPPSTVPPVAKTALPPVEQGGPQLTITPMGSCQRVEPNSDWFCCTLQVQNTQQKYRAPAYGLKASLLFRPYRGQDLIVQQALFTKRDALNKAGFLSEITVLDMNEATEIVALVWSDTQPTMTLRSWPPDATKEAILEFGEWTCDVMIAGANVRGYRRFRLRLQPKHPPELTMVSDTELRGIEMFMYEGQIRYTCPHCDRDHYDQTEIEKHIALDHQDKR
jgi:hypothetical protein